MGSEDVGEAPCSGRPAVAAVLRWQRPSSSGIPQNSRLSSSRRSSGSEAFGLSELPSCVRSSARSIWTTRRSSLPSNRLPCRQGSRSRHSMRSARRPLPSRRTSRPPCLRRRAPGGFAMGASIPADITQYYVHAFRVMQKLAYLNGWQSFLNDLDDVDDETLGKLSLFLGVMMGVGSASVGLTNFAQTVARPALQKQISKQALTKTAWYGPMKQVLGLVGTRSPRTLSPRRSPRRCPWSAVSSLAG